MAKKTPEFLVQRRTVSGIRQWDAGRYGRQTRISYSPWKTIMRFAELEKAKQFCRGFIEGHGLEELRVKFGSSVVWKVL